MVCASRAGELIVSPSWKSWVGGPDVFQWSRPFTFLHMVLGSLSLWSNFWLSQPVLSLLILAFTIFRTFLYSLQSSGWFVVDAEAWSKLRCFWRLFVSSDSQGAYLDLTCTVLIGAISLRILSSFWVRSWATLFGSSHWYMSHHEIWVTLLQNLSSSNFFYNISSLHTGHFLSEIWQTWLLL